MKQGSVCPKTMSIIRRNVHFQTYTRLYFFAAVEHFPLLTHRQGNGKLIAENTLMAGICKGFVSCHSLIILFGLQQRFARLCEIPCLTAKSLPSWELQTLPVELLHRNILRLSTQNHLILSHRIWWHPISSIFDEFDLEKASSYFCTEVLQK